MESVVGGEPDDAATRPRHRRTAPESRRGRRPGPSGAAGPAPGPPEAYGRRPHGPPTGRTGRPLRRRPGGHGRGPSGARRLPPRPAAAVLPLAPPDHLG